MPVNGGRGARPVGVAVVLLLQVVQRPGDIVLVDGAAGDLEPAVLDHERNVGEVLVGVGELRGLQAHGVLARVGALGHGVAREAHVGLGVQRVVGGDEGVALDALLGPVVGPGCGAALDGDGHLGLDGLHRQVALGLGDLVVLGLGVALQLVGEPVLAGAGLGLGAGDVVDRALALGEAVARHGDVGLGVPDKRIAVVGLLAGRGRQGQDALGDDQLAAVRGHLELGGDVVALRVLHDCDALDHALIGADVGSLGGRGQAGDGVLDAVELKGISLEAGHRLLPAVVGDGAGFRLHLDLTLRELLIPELHYFRIVFHDDDRGRIRLSEGIPLDRNLIAREVELFARHLGSYKLVANNRRFGFLIYILKADGTKTNFIKVDVTVQMPRIVVRSVIVDSTRSRFQSSWLIFHRPFDVFQVDVVDAMQFDIVWIAKGRNYLVIIVTGSHVTRRVRSWRGYAINPNTSDGIPTVVINLQRKAIGVAHDLCIKVNIIA